jgi:hypothetical protein
MRSWKRDPQDSIAAVWSLVHNRLVERFAALRYALTHRAKPSSDSNPAQVASPAEPETEDAPNSSRLPGLLVLLLPLAALAWAAIGWFVYRLIT